MLLFVLMRYFVQKYANSLWWLVKFVVVLGGCWLLYGKITEGQRLFNTAQLPRFTGYAWSAIGLSLLVLSTLNWLTEALKWKLLVQSISTITFSLSLKQSLMAHAAALVTPFKAGDFGLKTLFYKKEAAIKVVYLNFLTNASQLFSTLLFGGVGLFFFAANLKWNTFFVDSKHIIYTALLSVGLTLLLVSGWKKFSKRNYRFRVPLKTQLKNIGLAMLRYLFFSHQWILLLALIKPSLSYIEIASAVFIMYAVASLVPVFALFDWAVKGSVAVLIMAAYGFDASLILAIALLVWMGNFLIPALVGLYFLLNFNLFKTKPDA